VRTNIQEHVATERAESILAPLFARSGTEPNATALVWVGDTVEPITTLTLVRRIAGYGNTLRAQGIRRDDSVLIAHEHGPELIGLFLGAMSCGAVPTLFPCPTSKLDVAGYGRRLGNAIAKLEPAAVVVPAQVEPFVRDLKCGGVLDVATIEPREDAEWCWDRSTAKSGEDVAFMQLSSGSTGRQKAIPVTHAAVLNMIEARHAALAITAGDVMVGWVPLYHDLGLVGNLLGPLIAGIPTVIIAPFQWLARPVSLMEAISHHSGTVCAMPNFAFGYCARKIRDEEMEGLDLTHWRVLSNTAEPVQHQSFRIFADRFSRWGFRPEAFVAAYGLAENTLTVTTTRLGQVPRVDWVSRKAIHEQQRAESVAEGPGAVPFVSCGVPLSNAEVEIRGLSGAALADRQVGEVVVRSNSTFHGYHRGDAERTHTLRDEWLHTGDLGYMADGQLYICGRLKDLIITSGANVCAEDIEAAVSSLDGMRPGRTVAFGVPDEVLGSERIVVIAELAPDAPDGAKDVERGIRKRVKAELDIAVSHVEFVEPGWIVKTTSGKLARWENKAKWLAEDMSPE
jgi:fatty-acyl-CoA synthase